MTKEELKQEAEEKAFSYVQLIPCAPYMEKRHREIDFREGYLAGAEPREKRIAELEKQIGILEQENEQLRKNLAENESDCEMCNFPKLKTELEKDNAELKEKLKKEGEIISCDTSCYDNRLKLQDQLTKAKEIIKKFLEFVNNEAEYDPEHPQEHTDLWNELCEEAEQFLNSEVEK